MAYRWDLWGAAVLINDAASGDGFAYFCRWLIAQSRAIFEAALADSGVTPGSTARKSALRRWTLIRRCGGKNSTTPTFPRHPSEPVGVKWSEENLDASFPRICARLPKIDEDEKLDRP